MKGHEKKSTQGAYRRGMMMAKLSDVVLRRAKETVRRGSERVEVSIRVLLLTIECSNGVWCNDGAGRTRSVSRQHATHSTV